MADVFISYRHGETDTMIAGRLADRLGTKFSVFHDGNRESIDFGSSFPDEIDEALKESRVLLAVIGPDWLGVKNLSRLHSEDDWVMRELRTALGRRGGIRVVPLLVKTDALPDPSSLPPDLRPLLKIQAYPLDPSRWEIDYRNLEGLVREWLSKPLPPVTPRPSMPPDVPYLCDRREQEDAFVELVNKTKASSGFIACVVHGHKWESHHELFDRIRNKGVLDDVFQSIQEGAGEYPIQLNKALLKEGRFADFLKNMLKSEVLRRRAVSDSELPALLRTLARPFVMIVQFTWSDCVELGESAIRKLVEAWHGLALTGPDGTVERLPYPALLWINVTYDEPDYELPRDVLHSPLPKLCSVEEGHIREWVVLDRVRPYVSGKKRELLDLPYNRRYCYSHGKVHMEHFAEGVHDIVAAV